MRRDRIVGTRNARDSETLGGYMSSRTISLKVPEVGFIAGTRVALGMGIGLLAAGKMDRNKRELTGWTLVAAGVISTVVIAKRIIGRARRPWYLIA
jgi:hypothetical protein